MIAGLDFNNYEEYLNSDLWRNKSEYLKKQKGRCEKCGSTEKLQVHHLNYSSLGNESMEDLIVLCKKCHKEEHDKNKRA